MRGFLFFFEVFLSVRKFFSFWLLVVFSFLLCFFLMVKFGFISIRLKDDVVKTQLSVDEYVGNGLKFDDEGLNLSNRC